MSYKNRKCVKTTKTERAYISRNRLTELHYYTKETDSYIRSIFYVNIYRLLIDKLDVVYN